jgi:hypothetical protein
MTLLARPSLQPKSAFSRFRPVHRADLEGQQRVDCAISPGRPAKAAICAFETFSGPSWTGTTLFVCTCSVDYSPTETASEQVLAEVKTTKPERKPSNRLTAALEVPGPPWYLRLMQSAGEAKPAMSSMLPGEALFGDAKPGGYSKLHGPFPPDRHAPKGSPAPTGVGSARGCRPTATSPSALRGAS